MQQLSRSFFCWENQGRKWVPSSCQPHVLTRWWPRGKIPSENHFTRGCGASGRCQRHLLHPIPITRYNESSRETNSNSGRLIDATSGCGCSDWHRISTETGSFSGQIISNDGRISASLQSHLVHQIRNWMGFYQPSTGDHQKPQKWDWNCPSDRNWDSKQHRQPLAPPLTPPLQIAPPSINDLDRTRQKGLLANQHVLWHLDHPPPPPTTSSHPGSEGARGVRRGWSGEGRLNITKMRQIWPSSD